MESGGPGQRSDVGPHTQADEATNLAGRPSHGSQTLRQYEIWWADVGGAAGRRPVLLLSRDSAYSYLDAIICAEITTHIRHIAVEVPVGRRHGLPRPSVVNLDNLHMVARARLVTRAGGLRVADVGAVKVALGHALAWRELKEIAGT